MTSRRTASRCTLASARKARAKEQWDGEGKINRQQLINAKGKTRTAKGQGTKVQSQLFVNLRSASKKKQPSTKNNKKKTPNQKEDKKPKDEEVNKSQGKDRDIQKEDSANQEELRAEPDSQEEERSKDSSNEEQQINKNSGNYRG